MKTPKQQASKAESELRKNPEIEKQAIKLITEMSDWGKRFTKLVKDFINDTKNDN